MTDTERIKRLAEWMGWKEIGWSESFTHHAPNGGCIYPDGSARVFTGIGVIPRREPWNPLECIHDAWMLVEKARMEYKFYLADGMFGDGWQCAFYKGSVSSAMTAPTAPLAICKAVERLMEEK